MEYKTVAQLEPVAEIGASPPSPALARSERLERWAELLEQEPNRRLKTLRQTEYEPQFRRDAMVRDYSPISVAFADPVLRAAGLKDDTYGEAKRFFGLTDRELHDVLCYCHHGETIVAATAAGVIRGISSRVAAATSAPKPGFLGRVRQFLQLL